MAALLTIGAVVWRRVHSDCRRTEDGTGRSGYGRAPAAQAGQVTDERPQVAALALCGVLARHRNPRVSLAHGGSAVFRRK